MKFISELKEIDRESIFEKKYMKIFRLGILLLIIGIILTSISSLYSTFSDADTMEEYETLLRTLGAISTFTRLTLQLGMVLFSLSTFMGAIIEKTLSDQVRRGMVFASSMAIIGLVLITIFSGLIM
ncbi:MAG: hypothetical protein ACW980_18025 [Promethearchaeota archaeon]